MRAMTVTAVFAAVTLAGGCGAPSKRDTLAKGQAALSIAFEAANQASARFETWQARRVAEIASTAPTEADGVRQLTAVRARAQVVDRAFVALYTAIGAAASVLSLAESGGADVAEAQKAVLAVAMAYQAARDAVKAAQEAP